MKRIIGFCCGLLALVLILSLWGNGAEGEQGLIRVHIRANSNSAADQSVKYAVRDAVVGYLTPLIGAVESLKEAKEIIKMRQGELRGLAESALRARGFSYGASVEIANEYFAAREYDGAVIPSGFYDALLIKLGDALGDNWFCVVYPPLCFLGADTNSKLKYRSLFLDIINSLKN